MKTVLYYYLPAGEAKNAVDCGLKLSNWHTREVYFDGMQRQCLVAYLNPKDDMGKFNNSDLVCVKVEIDERQCFVGDGFLYNLSESSSELTDLYINTLMPIGKYVFGTFRLPECLIFSTLIPGQISMLDRRLDIPVLYDNSEQLYLECFFETCKEKYPDFLDASLFLFFRELAASGDNNIRKIQVSENRFAIYSMNGDTEIVKLKMR
ncbi:MAG: hypothetical protein Q7J78_02155 [Clostridiales bacterium]|nr:hypothetical protein [Clostridiales bacterium]